MSASLVFFSYVSLCGSESTHRDPQHWYLQRKIIRHLLSFFPANFTLEPSYFFCGEVFSCLLSVVHIGHTDSLIASHAFVSAISAVLTVDSYPVFTCLKGPSLMLFIHCMWDVGVVGHFYLFMSTPSNDEWNRTDISGLDILPQQYVVFKFYLGGKRSWFLQN